MTHDRSLSRLALAGVAASAVGNGMAGELPRDPCGLVTSAEVEAVAGGAKVGKGVVDSGAAPMGTMCRYTWGPRTPQWGQAEATIMVVDVSRAAPGRGRDVVTGNLRTQQNATAIAGIGEVAVSYAEPRSYNGVAETYVKARDLHLQVKIHGGDPQASKESATTLLRGAAKRL